MRIKTKFHIFVILAAFVAIASCGIIINHAVKHERETNFIIELNKKLENINLSVNEFEGSEGEISAISNQFINFLSFIESTFTPMSELNYQNIPTNIKQLLSEINVDNTENIHTAANLLNIYSGEIIARSIYKDKVSHYSHIAIDISLTILMLSTFISSLIMYVKYKKNKENEINEVVKSKEMYRKVTELMQQQMLEIDKNSKDEQVFQERLFQIHKRQMLGEMAGGIAHEFNNILTPIMLLTNTFKSMSKDNKNILSMIDGINSNCKRAKNLIAQIHIFSGKSEIKENNLYKISELNSLLSEILTFNTPDNICVNCSYEDTNKYIRVNQSNFFKAVISVFDNSIKAIRESGVLSEREGKIEVQSSIIKVDKSFYIRDREVQPSEYLLIKISDNGIGIGADIMPFIFDPFFTSREVGKGTGMGLSVTLGIISAFNGHVSVKSKGINSGTDVKIYVPAIEIKKEVDNGNNSSC